MTVDLEIVGQHLDAILSLSASDRKTYLEEINNKELKAELLSLLAYVSPSKDPLEKKITLQVQSEIPDLNAGEKIGHFIVLKKVGEGSFGKVYLAHDTTLERQVALKVTPLTGNEAQAMAHLEHENIVRVFSEESFPKTNTRIICMQYVPGTTLADLSVAQLKNYRSILNVVGALSEAMQLAHSKGILHLDIKPENVLLDGQCKAYLTDFNISRLNHVQNEGLLGGTTDYMSPEHSRALYTGDKKAFELLGESADVFSMGVLFENLLKQSSLENIPPEVFKAMNEIIDDATKISISERISGFNILSSKIADLKAFDLSLEKLPKVSSMDLITDKFPRVSLFLGILIPQILGSIVNISYNAIQIVAKLNVSQKGVFYKLLFVINPIVYVIAIVLVVRKFQPVFSFLNKERIRSQALSGKAILLCTSGPSFIALITTLCWGISAYLFPLMIDFYSPTLSLEVYFHFAVSFFLSWLIAMTYSFLNTQYLLVRKIYPRIWNLRSLLKERREVEFAKIESRLKLFPFFAGAVPMVGALLLVLVGYERNLLISFILMGILGLAFALNATKKMLTVLYALKS